MVHRVCDDNVLLQIQYALESGSAIPHLRDSRKSGGHAIRNIGVNVAGAGVTYIYLLRDDDLARRGLDMTVAV